MITQKYARIYRHVYKTFCYLILVDRYGLYYMFYLNLRIRDIDVRYRQYDWYVIWSDTVGDKTQVITLDYALHRWYHRGQ